MDILEIFVTLGFWAALVRMATPLIFGTLGELICERAGVLNLGIEGIMTMGAMVAWYWVYQGGDLWTAVLVAAAFGALFGLLHSLFSVYLGVSQHVTGIGITLLAASLSYFAFRMLLPNVTTPPKAVIRGQLTTALLLRSMCQGHVRFFEAAMASLLHGTAPEARRGEVDRHHSATPSRLPTWRRLLGCAGARAYNRPVVALRSLPPAAASLLPARAGPRRPTTPPGTPGCAPPPDARRCRRRGCRGRPRGNRCRRSCSSTRPRR